MRNLKGLLFTLAGLTVLAGCGRPGPPLQVQRPLNVGWFLWTGWYPMAIAQELKLFEKHGVAVNPILYPSYMAILPDLGSGKLDAGFSGMYETLKSDIPSLRIVLVTDHSVGAEGLVVAPSIVTPQDLKGKRIGYQGALSGSEFLLTTFLRANNLSAKDLSFIGVSPETVLDRMPEEIQGGYTWDPFLSRAREKGYRVLFTTADMPGLIVDVVAFHESVLRARPEDVRRFIAAWFEAVEYWRQHPREAAAIIAKATGQKPEDISLQGCRLFTRQDNLDTFKPGNDFRSIYYTADRQVEFFISVGDASMVPNTAKVLTSDFLR